MQIGNHYAFLSMHCADNKTVLDATGHYWYQSDMEAETLRRGNRGEMLWKCPFGALAWHYFKGEAPSI